MDNEFTQKIIQILTHHVSDEAMPVMRQSLLLGYIERKTKSANQGSKARGSFANLYALYVLIEDYIQKGFLQNPQTYTHYEGARFSDLLERQRQLPFGAKLQNHALNSRLNEEFKKFFPDTEILPIVRDLRQQRYWIQTDLLEVNTGTKTHNIAQAILEIIEAYTNAKKAAFERFLEACKTIAQISNASSTAGEEFIAKQINPNTDARIFEIVSFALLKIKYGQQHIWIGDTQDSVQPQSLVLYKTGRTNANDGGIDFVMRPLGRFFQVTETTDFRKYFLDIEKVQHFPMTFVVKSTQSKAQILEQVAQHAKKFYKIEAVVQQYLEAIEDILTVGDLLEVFSLLVSGGFVSQIMEEIVLQSHREFNLPDE
jgi:hypothetical protein